MLDAFTRTPHKTPTTAARRVTMGPVQSGMSAKGTNESDKAGTSGPSAAGVAASASTLVSSLSVLAVSL